MRHRCVVDPDRQILGNAEVPEGVLLWDKINTLVADYGEKREGEERGESASLALSARFAVPPIFVFPRFFSFKVFKSQDPKSLLFDMIGTNVLIGLRAKSFILNEL